MITAIPGHQKNWIEEQMSDVSGFRSDDQGLAFLWNIPYQRNEFFTGREDVLTHLHEELQARNTAALTQPQGISGLGGIVRHEVT